MASPLAAGGPKAPTAPGGGFSSKTPSSPPPASPTSPSEKKEKKEKKDKKDKSSKKSGDKAEGKSGAAGEGEPEPYDPMSDLPVPVFKDQKQQSTTPPPPPGTTTNNATATSQETPPGAPPQYSSEQKSGVNAGRSGSPAASGGGGGVGWSKLRDAVAVGGVTPGNRTQEQENARRTWKAKLFAYFALVGPHKQKDIDAILDHYEDKPNGYEAMWEHAQTNFGPAPSAEKTQRIQERKQWFDKLKAYYTIVDAGKTDAEIEEALDHFYAKAGGPKGYEKMWKAVQQRYGVIVDKAAIAVSVAGDRSRNKDNMSSLHFASHQLELEKQQQQQQKNNPLGGRGGGTQFGGSTKDIIKPRVVVMVVIGGIQPKAYRNGGPARQYKFNVAVANEVKVAMNLDEALTVQNVSEGVDCVIVEMDATLPEDSNPAIFGSMLVKKITVGEFPVSNIRRAYVEYLDGNPQRVFVIDGCCSEYRCTPGFRYHLKMYDETVSQTANADPREFDAIVDHHRLASAKYSRAAANSVYDPDPGSNLVSAGPTPVGKYQIAGAWPAGSAAVESASSRGVTTPQRSAPSHLGTVAGSTYDSTPQQRQMGAGVDYFSSSTNRATEIHRRRTERYAVE